MRKRLSDGVAVNQIDELMSNSSGHPYQCVWENAINS